MKHKNFKSLLSMFLVLCMVLTLLPVNDVTVKAAENVSETITIPETGYKEFASDTAEGTAAVATGATDGWYWDGNGNFYLRNCDLKLTGGTETAGKTKSLLYFPMNTTLHLTGANSIVLDNIKMCYYGTVLGKGASVSINFKGTNKKTDSLTFRKTDSCSPFNDYKEQIADRGEIYFYRSDYSVSHIIQNCSLIVPEEGTGFRFSMNKITIENADINIYQKPTDSYTVFIDGCSLTGSTTISWKGNSLCTLVITNLNETWNKYIVENAHKANDSETVYSGKTIEALLVGLDYPRLDMRPVDENQPIIIKPGAPTEYALTCTAGSGINKDSFSVGYTHEDIAGGEQKPEPTDGSYSIQEGAAVTVKMNLQAEAAFQNCTGLPSGAKLTKGEDGTVTVSFTMPSEDITLTAYGYKGIPASGTAVVKKSTLLDPCVATVTLTGNTAGRTVTLVRGGEEPLLLTGTDVTTYKENLPQDGCTYKVYVDGADTGKTIILNSTSASASVAYKTYTVTATKDGVVYADPGFIQLMAGDTLVGNGASLPQGTYDIYLDGEKVGKTSATGNNVLAFYTVTFKNGAETSEAYPAGSYYQPQVVLSGKTAVAPEVTPEAPEGMEDMFFAGWEKDSTAFDFATPITAATTLTAKWITEAQKTEESDIEAKWTINGESSYGLLSDALAATKTAGRGQILLLKDSVALKAERENELAANVTLTVPENKGITNAQTLTAKGTISNKGTISCKVTNSGTITNSGSLASVTNLSCAKITNTGTIASADNAGSITGGVITTASNTGTIKGAKVGINTSTGTLDGCTITSGTGINGTVKGYTYAADAVTFATNADTQGTINIGGDTTYRTLIKAQNEAGTEKALKVNIITRSTLTESGTLDLDGHSIKGADGNSTAKDGVTPLKADADLTMKGTGSVTGGIGYSYAEAGNGGHGIDGNGHSIVIDSNVTVTGGIGGAGISGAAKGGQGGCGVHMGTHDSESTTGTATIAGTVIGGRGGAAVENGSCGKGGYGVCGTDIVDNGGEYQPGKGGDGRTSDPTNNTLTPPQNGEEGKGTENPVKYGVTYQLTGLEVSGEKPEKVTLDDTLSVQLCLETGSNPYLVIPNSITVTMKGQLLEADKYTYDKATGTVEIPDVKGAVKIKAEAELVSEVEGDTESELRGALEAGVPKIIVTENITLEQKDGEGKPLGLTVEDGITISIKEGKVIDLAACPYTKQGTVTGAGRVVRTLKGKLIGKDSTPVEGATVKLMLGTTQVNTTTTEADGTYLFGNLDQGIYKLVFEKKDGTTEIQAEDMMILPIETEKPVNPLTTKLLAENYRAVVEIKSGVPVSEVAVGGLNEQFASENLVTDSLMGITSEDVAGGNTVELKLTVDKVPAANAEQVNKIKQKMEEIGDSGKKLIPIDISVTKTVTPEGSAPTSTKLVATKQLIIVVIPLKGELEGKSDYVLYRYHKEGETGSVEKIQKTTNSGGEYIEVFGDHMIAHLKKFSTYGIGYTPLPSESEGGSPSGGGTSSAIFVQKIELSSSANTLTKKGETIQINATITPYYATDKKLTWSSSDNSVATVDENGKVTAVSDGTVTITAKSRNGVTAEVTIVVKLEKEQDTDDSKEDNGKEDNKEDNKEENKNDDKENVTDKDKTDTTDITPDNTFRKLRLRSSKVTRNSSTLVWNKVKEADGYIVYGAQCNSNGKVYKIKKIATIKDNSTVTYKAKALKSGTYYKYCVVAYKLVNKKQTIIAKSKVIHVATSSGKYGNYKAVKVNKAKVELKAGKTYTIKATQVKEKKPVKKHADIHFETSNSKIAAVNKKGVITAKGKGTCTIYVYAQNGIYKTVKVTVK